MFKKIAVLSSISDVIDYVEKKVLNRWPLFKDQGNCAFVLEKQSKMGRSRHCSEEECSLIKKLIKELKTYKEVQKMIGCSAKMISNALKWQPKPER